MDRFLDEQENPSSVRDRSSSPSSNIPIFGDKKRTPLTSPETNADSSTPELSMQGLDNMDGPSSTSTFSTGTVSTSMEREHLSCKNQSTNDYNKDFINGENRVTSTTPTSPKENVMCLNLESLTVVSENIPIQTDSTKNIQINPPSDVVSCSRILNDVPRFHEGCNFRFEYGKDSVSID